MHKNHKDPQELDLTKPRLASYEKKWKRHQDKVYWVDKKLAQKKGFKFYQTKIERNHPLRHTHSLLYPESKCDELKEIIYQKVYVSPRPPQKISFKDNWMKELDSEVAGGSQDSQHIQPKIKNPIIKNGGDL